MGKLIVLSRPGIQVVCGTVVESRPEDNEFVIENDVYFGGRKQTEKRRIRIHSFQTERMKLRPGVNVIASIKPNEMLYALYDGVDLPVLTYDADAFIIRYTGAFDFDTMGLEKEAHVFAANVMSNKQLNNGGNIITISWKRNQGSEVRTLYAPVDIKNKLSNKAVFVTGAPQKTKAGSLYCIKNFMNF